MRLLFAGVSLMLPHGWSHIPFVPAPPSGNDPVTRIAAASSPIAFGQCNEISYRFSPRGVAIVVLEYLRPTPARFAPRPARFRFPLDNRLECGLRGGGVQFVDHRRRFDVFVLVGRRAPARLKRQALAVLDTLRVR